MQKNQKELKNKEGKGEESAELVNVDSMSLDDLLEMEFPEQEWLVKGLVPASAITIFSAPPASYKTWSMAHLAVAVAKGEPFYGHFETAKSGVLIVDEENGERHLRHQLRLLGATKGLPIRIRSRHNFTLSDEGVKLVLRDCKAYGLKTVMFDSLVDIHRASENDAIAMAEVMKYLQVMAASGITVIVLHHNRKPGINSFGGGNEMRGSTAILAATDANIALSIKGEDRLRVKPLKLRQAKLPKSFEVLIYSDDDSFSFEHNGEEVAKSSKEEKARASILEILANNEGSLLSTSELDILLRESGDGVNDKMLKRVLDQLVAENLITRTNGNGNTKLYALTPTNQETAQP